MLMAYNYHERNGYFSFKVTIVLVLMQINKPSRPCFDECGAFLTTRAVMLQKSNDWRGSLMGFTSILNDEQDHYCTWSRVTYSRKCVKRRVMCMFTRDPFTQMRE